MDALDKLIREGKKALNLEQAMNYLKNHRKHVAKEIKEQAQESKISIAPEDDRLRYLRYCISLLKVVDEDIMRLMPENIRVMYSNKEMANFFRWFLELRLQHASFKYLSHEVGVPEKLLKTLDVCAQEAVYRAIDRARKTGIPLVGGI